MQQPKNMAIVRRVVSSATLARATISYLDRKSLFSINIEATAEASASNSSRNSTLKPEVMEGQCVGCAGNTTRAVCKRKPGRE